MRRLQLDPEHVNTNQQPTPEQDLVVAILRQVVADIRHTHPGTASQRPTPSVGDQLDAIEWILSGTELCVFAGLLGLDEDFLRASLLSTVGASDAPPRLGARREPLTKPTRLYQRRS